MAWTHQRPSLIAASSFLIWVREVNSSSSVISEAEFQFPIPLFSSFAQSCPTLCNPKDYSTPGFPVHHQLLELAQPHVHRVSGAIQPSHPLSSPFPPAFNLSQHQGLFQWVNSSHQVAKVLALQSVLPVNVQSWFPLGLTGLISLQSKGLSRVFSNTTFQKHQFFGTQLSFSMVQLSHLHTWLLQKP